MSNIKTTKKMPKKIIIMGKAHGTKQAFHQGTRPRDWARGLPEEGVIKKQAPV